MREHYGIEVPTSAARRITQLHANNAQATAEASPIKKGRAKEQIIAETDGCMIPIVVTKESELGDKRKGKELIYREARLSLAHEKSSKELRHAGTFGSVEVAGQQLFRCVEEVGQDEHTKVHCVGDGATWIANQVEERFGAHGTYLIDFYHLCEYLSKAASSCCGNSSESEWKTTQKRLMKNNESEAVLRNLKPYVEPRNTPATEAPVLACYRYIKNRPLQLDYKTAIEKELPIGSGEVESSHRYIAQQRLKIAGAWWKFENAEAMLALRVCRANNEWDSYWKKAA
jgi:hypothetical protein